MGSISCSTKLSIAFGIVTAVTCSGFLDLDELKTSFYSVRISDVPLPIPQSTEDQGSRSSGFGEDDATMQVSSKYGQKYVCHYKHSPTKRQEESVENVAGINITDLLEPMRGMCLTKTKDWWSYRFCYGAAITQFHLHNGQISGDVITLGKYESDKTWLPEDLAKLKKSTVNRYHTQQYVNGSVCDLTNKPRRTEVRFSCVESDMDHVGAIAELESCSYILFIYTSKICHHPYLRPPVQATASAIECQPLVSRSIYDDYLSQLAAEKLSNQNEEGLSNMDDINKLIKKAMSDVGINVKTVQTTAEDITSATPDTSDISESASESATSESAASESEASADAETAEPDTSTAEDLNAKSASSLDDTSTDDEDKGMDESSNSLTKSQIQEKKLMELLSNAMDDYERKDTVSKYRESIRKYVSEQFDEIIAEARREVEESGTEANVASSEADIEHLKNIMSNVLDQKLGELQDAEQLSAAETGLQKSSEEGAPAKPHSVPDEDAQSTDTGSGDQPSDDDSKKDVSVETTRKSKLKFKIEVRQQPQQLEVEMIDLDDISENSEYYDTAKKAKQQQAAGTDNKQLKTVIAVLRPMQEKGTRQEERKYQNMEDNYGKQWTPSAADNPPRDEL